MRNATALDFFPSITVSVGQISKTMDMWRGKTGVDPFSKIMLTPLTARLSTMELVREQCGNWEIMFDSGGFLIQQGFISYNDLCIKLRELYCANPWANWMILPDNVPTSQDNIEVVFEKIKKTVNGSLEFFHTLPDYLKDKAIPVIHGRTLDQICYCFDAYLKVGFKTMCFGGFATTGRNNNMNRFTTEVIHSLAFVSRIAKDNNIRIHALGISSPAQVALLKLAQLHSFDSSGWMRSAGHGFVYLPYSSGTRLHLTRDDQTSVSEIEFSVIRQESGHYCPFCEDFKSLGTSRYLRMLHNLSVTMDVACSTEDETTMIMKMRHNAKRLYTYAETLLQMRQ